MSDKLYSIEETAQRLSVTARTLHYYEEIGLIEEVDRTEGGHRLYREETIQQVEHILRLKDILGVSLKEIRIILEAEKELEALKVSYYSEESGSRKKRLLSDAERILHQQMEHIDAKIAKLQSMRDAFAERLARTHTLREQQGD